MANLNGWHDWETPQAVKVLFIIQDALRSENFEQALIGHKMFRSLGDFVTGLNLTDVTTSAEQLGTVLSLLPNLKSLKLGTTKGKLDFTNYVDVIAQKGSKKIEGLYLYNVEGFHFGTHSTYLQLNLPMYKHLSIWGDRSPLQGA